VLVKQRSFAAQFIVFGFQFSAIPLDPARCRSIIQRV
jgi:hypothetical protein